MAESVYEGMFLLDSGRYTRDPEEVAGQVPKMIQEAGGQILVSRLWEERRLAYSIKGHRKGVYWLTYFRLDGSRLPEIRRKCRLSDSILRVLFVKVHPRIVDTLVEHAQTSATASASEDAPGGLAPEAEKADRERSAARGEKSASAAGEAAADHSSSEDSQD